MGRSVDGNDGETGFYGLDNLVVYLLEESKHKYFIAFFSFYHRSEA